MGIGDLHRGETLSLFIFAIIILNIIGSVVKFWAFGWRAVHRQEGVNATTIIIIHMKTNMTHLLFWWQQGD